MAPQPGGGQGCYPDRGWRGACEAGGTRHSASARGDGAWRVTRQLTARGHREKRRWDRETARDAGWVTRRASSLPGSESARVTESDAKNQNVRGECDPEPPTPGQVWAPVVSVLPRGSQGLHSLFQPGVGLEDEDGAGEGARAVGFMSLDPRNPTPRVGT